MVTKSPAQAVPGILLRGCCGCSGGMVLPVADIPAHNFGSVWPRSRIERPSHECARPRPLTGASKDAKRPLSPAPGGLRLTASPKAPN